MDKPQKSLARYAVAIEVADNAMRLDAAIVSSVASTMSERPPRRWHRSLLSPATPEVLAQAVVELADEVIRACDLSPADDHVALCVVLWATVDPVSGRVIRWRRMNEWSNVPLRDILGVSWAGPVILEHAVRAAARAEQGVQRGAAGGPLLYVYIGRSIWSAVVNDTCIRAGWQGEAGAFGHVQVVPDGPRCSCGARGHLEPIASAQALVRNYIGEASATDESTSAMLAVSHMRAEAISVRQIVQLADHGERAAQAVIERGISALSMAVANACVVLAPERVVIAGPITQAGDTWLSRVRERVGSALEATLTPPRVEWTTLGEVAIWRGALHMGIVLASDGLNPEKLAGL